MTIELETKLVDGFPIGKGYEIPDVTRHESSNWEGKGPEWEPCFLCSRPVRTDRKTTYWIEVFDGGTYAASQARVNNVTIDREDPGYMGMFVVGPACRKLLPKDAIETKVTR